MRNLNCLPILLTIHRVWKKFYCFIYLGLLMEEVLQNFRKIVSQKTFKFITDCIPQSNFQQGFKKFHRYFKGSWWSKILQKKLTVSPTEFWVQNSPHIPKASFRNSYGQKISTYHPNQELGELRHWELKQVFRILETKTWKTFYSLKNFEVISHPDFELGVSIENQVFKRCSVYNFNFLQIEFSLTRDEDYSSNVKFPGKNSGELSHTDSLRTEFAKQKSIKDNMSEQEEWNTFRHVTLIIQIAKNEKKKCFIAWLQSKF